MGRKAIRPCWFAEAFGGDSHHQLVQCSSSQSTNWLAGGPSAAGCMNDEEGPSNRFMAMDSASSKRSTGWRTMDKPCRQHDSPVCRNVSFCEVAMTAAVDWQRGPRRPNACPFLGFGAHLLQHGRSQVINAACLLLAVHSRCVQRRADTVSLMLQWYQVRHHYGIYTSASVSATVPKESAAQTHRGDVGVRLARH